MILKYILKSLCIQQYIAYLPCTMYCAMQVIYRVVNKTAMAHALQDLIP
jgi:hypothetical protein